MNSNKEFAKENQELKQRLSEAEELLAAIKSGSVDALITDDQKVFTLKGADKAYRVFVETMNEGAATLTSEGTVMYCNKRLAKMLKVISSEVTGNSIFKFASSEDLVSFKRLLKQGLSSSRGNITLIRKDGKEISVNIGCNPLRSQPNLICAVFTDVSKLKAAQRAVERANSKLEARIKKRTAELNAANDQLNAINQELVSINEELTCTNERLIVETAVRRKIEDELKLSNENLEQFAYAASHDLKEPLRMMSSYSELLERRYKGKLDQDADDFINFIVDGSKRMQKLISDILEYSKMGNINRITQKVDCNVVVERVKNSLAQALKESGASIACSELPLLNGNENYFFRIFQNLIDNALKFRGELPLRVHLSSKKKGSEWEFCVRDNGIGIDPADYDKLFKIFHRLQDRSKYPGTGIGLAICKKIVDNLGGRIWVESEPGQGAAFYFTVPVKELNGKK